jgi:hypothetical protein
MRQRLETQPCHFVACVDRSGAWPMFEHLLRMFHRRSSVAAQTFRSKALLQKAALLSPLVALADKDAFAVKDP